MLKSIFRICKYGRKCLNLRSESIYGTMTTKEDNRKFNRIKAALAETGHTGKWLAEQLGKNPATVSKWCTNTSQPDLYTLNNIARLMGIEINQLLY